MVSSNRWCAPRVHSLTDSLQSFFGKNYVGCSRRFRGSSKTVNNLRFADDIDLMAGKEEHLQTLTTRLDETSKRYGMEVSTEKSKTMITGGQDTTLNIRIGNNQLEHVKKFCYLGSTITQNVTSDQEIKERIGKATSALVKLSNI